MGRGDVNLDRAPRMDAEHLQQTVEALTTLALCQHGQVVALGTAVEALLAVLCKQTPGLAAQLDAHLALCARDHRDPDWHLDQRTAFDNQVQRLQTLLDLLQSHPAQRSSLAGR